MTIKSLIEHQPTVSIYEVLQRADVAFARGRYFGGPLSAGEVRYLTDGVELREDTKSAIQAFIEA